MSNHILIIAHTPLAHALRQCALHVFPDCGELVTALDVEPGAQPEQTLVNAQATLQALPHASTTLVLTDIVGATPCNVAQRLVDGVHSRLVAGVNLPMLLRAICYRNEPLEDLVNRATTGGIQGVVPMAVPRITPPSPEKP